MAEPAPAGLEGQPGESLDAVATDLRRYLEGMRDLPPLPLNAKSRAASRLIYERRAWSFIRRALNATNGGAA